MAGHDVSGELRDDHGRWTEGGAPSVALSNGADDATRAKATEVVRMAAESAKALGFDPSKITVTDENKTFELNGTTRHYAGSADLNDGTVKLYMNHVSHDAVPGTTAHEVQHQKFERFFKDYRAEYDAMQKDPDYHKENTWVPFDPSNESHVRMRAAGDMMTTDGKIREKGFMRPDGLLNEPYAERYPTYQAWTKAMMPSSADFAKTDGVSSYSRDWWDAYHANTAQLHQAMHETLAEMARTRFEGHPVQHIMRQPPDDQGRSFFKVRKKVDPIWNALYKATEDHWKRVHK